MKNKATVRIIAAFSIIVFLVVLIAIALMSAIFVVMFRHGYITRPNAHWPMLFLGILSVVISTILANFIGKRGLAPVIKLTDATKEIAKGNFDVRLDENIRFREVKEMSQNFNLMAKELSNIETFRSDFIANVSHEFKTPISSIEGYVTLLQNSGLSDAERDDYIARILKSTKRLSALSGNILQISQLENQDIRPPSKEFMLDEQIRQIVLLFEPEWTKKRLYLDIDMDSAAYSGNQNMLAQVWQNIFENAIKFTPEDGLIRITLKKEGGFIKVTFSDSGIGMDEEVARRVFEKFYKGDKSHTTAGSGLGLTLAKRIIDLHGGTIDIESTPQKGSSFTISLPLKSS